MTWSLSLWTQSTIYKVQSLNWFLLTNPVQRKASETNLEVSILFKEEGSQLIQKVCGKNYAPKSAPSTQDTIVTSWRFSSCLALFFLLIFFFKELSYPKTLAESAKLGSLKSVGLHLKMHDTRKPKLKTSIAELHARLKHQRRHAPFWTTGDWDPVKAGSWPVAPV